MPDEFNPPGILFWRRPTDSRFPTRSPAARAGLTIYLARFPSARPLTASGVPPRRASSKRAAQKCKSPAEINPAGLLVLATSYSRTAYRRTTIGAAAFHCRVRNGNGWGHCAIVTRGPSRAGNCGASHRERPTRISGDGGVHRGGRPIISLRGQRPRLQHFQKNMISNPQSPIENPQYFWFSDIYIQVFGKFRGQRPRLQLFRDQRSRLQLSFGLRSFVSSVDWNRGQTTPATA